MIQYHSIQSWAYNFSSRLKQNNQEVPQIQKKEKVAQGSRERITQVCTFFFFSSQEVYFKFKIISFVADAEHHSVKAELISH